jgi:hypothetical protein
MKRLLEQGGCRDYALKKKGYAGLNGKANEALNGLFWWIYTDSVTSIISRPSIFDEPIKKRNR